ncbi:MAG: SpoIID/LytB domain-containing protein, partial [Microcystaceae cyanobacterium]
MPLSSVKKWLESVKPVAIWTIPLLSVISVPLALSYWAISHRDSANIPAEVAVAVTEPATSSAFPPLSQLSKSVPDSAELLKPIPLAKAASPVTKAIAPKSTSNQVATGGTIKSAMLAPDPLPPLPKTLANPATTKVNQSKTQQGTTLGKKAEKKAIAAKSPSPQAARRSQTAVKQASYVAPPLEIRVGVVRNEASATVGSSGPAFLQERTGKSLGEIAPNQPLTVIPSGSSLLIGGRKMPAVTWLTPAKGSLVHVGDRWYRGRILLVSKGDSVLAVNYVDLEHYLTSVVGSEMHANAPSEALKAQAIAARSYALVHMIRPASDWFDLGDNQRWQVYKGLNSEYNTGFKAVGDTAGQVLSYKGGVVESLYASTDAIVASAHKGRGMSQLGAYDLA